MTSSISAWIWSERFWLPENVTWADLERPPAGVEYPRLGRLYLYGLPLAVGVFLLRVLFERLVAKPCAHILRIQGGAPRKAQPNDVLERVYQNKTCPDSRHLEGLSKQLDWDVRKIQRWFRIRRNQDRPSTQKKFCESMWRFTFYLGIFIYAIRHLWVSPWMWDVRLCWHNYPFQSLSPGQYNYYIAELAFYWSLMFSQFIDIKRKDFMIMLVHHLATIMLITFSYGNNMVRIGTLVMCVHDASDIFLEVKNAVMWSFLTAPVLRGFCFQLGKQVLQIIAKCLNTQGVLLPVLPVRQEKPTTLLLALQWQNMIEMCVALVHASVNSL